MNVLKYWSLIVIIVTLGFVAVSAVYAATDDIIVSTIYGDDATPPSVPGSLTATPVATSQINLVWATSTDNLSLSGYQVFRDGVQIASTTAPNYADVGLTASTTYAYFVTAFDSFVNISASSTEVSTTTLASSTTPEPDEEETVVGSTQSGTLTAPLEIVWFEIIPGKDSVIIRYETKGHVRSVVRWGRSLAYELGSSAERSFSTFHKTTIEGLAPGVTYSFSIDGEHGLGKQGVLKSGTFKTLPPDDTFPPQNVGNLRAVLEGNDIVLTWQNPPDNDFQKVRVQKSDSFYPVDIADGFLLYEGEDESVRDLGAGVLGARLYYSVFSYDELGNISSGAVVGVTVALPSVAGTSTPALPIVVPIEPSVSTENPIDLQFEDLEFYQEGEEILSTDTVVSVDGTKSLTVSLPYDLVPEHLKTITITVADGLERHTFLLRINKERSAYTSTLAPIGRSGDFPVTVALYDYKTAQIGYTYGTVRSMTLAPERVSDAWSLGTMLRELFTKEMGWIIGGSLLLIFLLILAARKIMRLLSPHPS